MKTYERRVDATARAGRTAVLLAATSMTAVLGACVAPGSEPGRNGTTLTPSSEPTSTGSVTVPGTDAATTTQASTPGTSDTSGPTSGPTTAPATTTTQPAPTGSSLRFFGTGSGQVDRVKIPLNGNTKANIGAGDFTIEVWIRGNESDNDPAGSCGTGEAAWITGNIFIDRDVFNSGDFGDFGLSLYDGRVAFGATRDSSGATICGSRNVLDGTWHHVAVTRQASNGRLQLYVDGQLDAEAASTGATGDISYRVGRGTQYPDSDPFLVLAAEKHDAGSGFPSFNGSLDELRLSTTIRYNGNFTRPAGPFTPDANTAALYHFNEGTGTTLGDEIGTSNGQLNVGGGDNGPQWTTDSPF
jgi:hypothetical protein